MLDFLNSIFIYKRMTIAVTTSFDLKLRQTFTFDNLTKSYKIFDVAKR